MEYRDTVFESDPQSNALVSQSLSLWFPKTNEKVNLCHHLYWLELI